MGLRDFFNNFTSRLSNAVPEDEYDDEYDEFEDESYAYEEDEHEVEPRAWQTAAANYDRSNKVVSINATARLNVVISHPQSYDDAQSIADSLIEMKTVVLNLENTQKDICRRIVDFLSGVAYANRGQIKKIANRTYIITPNNVQIAGAEVIDELENNGVFF